MTSIRIIRTSLYLVACGLLVLPFNNCSEASFENLLSPVDDSNVKKDGEEIPTTGGGDGGGGGNGGDHGGGDNNSTDDNTNPSDQGDPGDNTPGTIPPENLPTCSYNQTTGPCIALRDSFEGRTQIIDDNFGWYGVLDDVGRTGVNAGLSLKIEDHRGEVTDGKNAAYFSGRPGGSVHHLFLISQPLDLASYQRLDIQFDYLPINLESWSYKGKSGKEHIMLEVCKGSVVQCGIKNDGSFDIGKLNGNSWETVFINPENDGQNIDDNLDEPVFQLSDWVQKIRVTIDLSKYKKDEFVFRFTVIVDEGIDQDDYNSSIDGVAIDNVLAIAYQ